MDIEDRQLDPRRVREQANKMGIQTNVPLPEVIIVGKDAEEDLGGGPLLHASATEDSPFGYFITIPESLVGSRSTSQINDDIRHELAHYLDHIETGSPTGLDEDPYEQALKELRAELRSKPRNLPLAVARQVGRLIENFGLSNEDAFGIMDRATRALGISKVMIKVKRLCRE